MYKIIKCPYCKYEYLPGEIFDPKHFLGQPKDIVRNSIGEILGFEGIEQDTTEVFTCTRCEKQFEIAAKINFVFNNEEELNFEQISLF